MTAFRWYVCRLLLVAAVGIGVTACAVGRGTTHEVKRGQTLWQIARTYEVDLDALIRVNDIHDVRRVRPGTRLVIPGVRRQRDVPRHRRAAAGESSSSVTTNASSPGSSSGDGSASGSPAESASGAETTPGSSGSSDREPTFTPRWPCRGTVISGFQKNGGPAHRGVLIRAERDEDVVAAEEGNVKLAGEWDRLPELGKIVIIFHTDDLTTVYAHLGSIRVSEGERVERGEPLGTVGASGRVDRPVCYFETRYKLEPRDPLIFLEEPS